MEKERRRDGRE
jgi:hypothetical protein